MWNFKQANWPKFSTKVDDQLPDTDDNDSPYILSIKRCDAMRKNTKSAIPKGKMHKYKPFWTKEFTNQRNKRSSTRNSRNV